MQNRWDAPIELSGTVYRALHKISSLKHLRIRLDVWPAPRLGIRPNPSLASTNGLPGISYTAGLNANVNPGSSSTIPPSMAGKKNGKRKKGDDNGGCRYWADPRAFSGFRHLTSLALMGLSNLECLHEISGCIKASSATLKALTVSVSPELARKARKPVVMNPELDDGSDTELEEDDTIDDPPLPPGQNASSAPPLDEADVRKERAAQDGILARIFDLQGVAIEGKKIEKQVSLAEARDKLKINSKVAESKFHEMVKKVFQLREVQEMDPTSQETRLEYYKTVRHIADLFFSDHMEKYGSKNQKKAISTSPQKTGANPEASTSSTPSGQSLGLDHASYVHPTWANATLKSPGQSNGGSPSKDKPASFWPLPKPGPSSSGPTLNPFAPSSGYSGKSKPSQLSATTWDAAQALTEGQYAQLIKNITSKKLQQVKEGKSQASLPKVPGPESWLSSDILNMVEDEIQSQPHLYAQLMEHKELPKLLMSGQLPASFPASSKLATGLQESMKLQAPDESSMYSEWQGFLNSPHQAEPGLGESTKKAKIKEEDAKKSKFWAFAKQIYSPSSIGQGKQQTFFAGNPESGSPDDDMDIDMEHPDAECQDLGEDQETDSAGEEVEVATPRKRMKVAAPSEEKVENAIDSSKVSSVDTNAPSVEPVSYDDAIHAYIRAAHGLQLTVFNLELIPLKASIVARALDLSVLQRVTLLDVGPQDAFWTLLARLQSPTAVIALKSIHTDSLSFPLLRFLGSYQGLEELFLHERGSKTDPYDSATCPTVLDIRRLALKGHVSTLRCLMIRNERNETWDIDWRTLQFLAHKATSLKELAINLTMKTYVRESIISKLAHTDSTSIPSYRILRLSRAYTHFTSFIYAREIDNVSQYLIPLICFQSVLIIHSYLSNSSMKAVYLIIPFADGENVDALLHSESLNFAIDSLYHCPEMKLKYIAVANTASTLDLQSHPSKTQSPNTASSQKDKKGKGKAPMGQPSLPWLDQSDGFSSDETEEALANTAISQQDKQRRLRFTTRFGAVDDVKIFSKQMRLGKLQ